MSEIVKLPMDEVRPSPSNDRRKFDSEGLRTLAESITTHGLAVPIIVRPSVIDTETHRVVEYEIVAGERRWRAHKLIGARYIDAVVRDLSDEEASAIMLIENATRRNLTPVEEAKAYRSRLDLGWKQDDLAKAAGVSRETIRKRINLLRLPEIVLHMLDAVSTNPMPLWVAEEMDGLSGEYLNRAVRSWCEGTTVSFTGWRRLCRKLKELQDQKGMFDDEFELVSEPLSGPKLTVRVVNALNIAVNRALKGCADDDPQKAEFELAARWLRGK